MESNFEWLGIDVFMEELPIGVGILLLGKC